MKILVALDKHHRRDAESQLASIEDVSKEAKLPLQRCASELFLLKNADYVDWYFHLGGPEGTSGHIMQKGREALQENYWVAKLETLPAEFITALIPAVVGLLLAPSSWQFLAGALVLGTGWRSAIRLLPFR
jgi:hypothetical protein